jgi:hypothetical protein
LEQAVELGLELQNQFFGRAAYCPVCSRLMAFLEKGTVSAKSKTVLKS